MVSRNGKLIWHASELARSAWRGCAPLFRTKKPTEMDSSWFFLSPYSYTTVQSKTFRFQRVTVCSSFPAGVYSNIYLSCMTDPWSDNRDVFRWKYTTKAHLYYKIRKCQPIAWVLNRVDVEKNQKVMVWNVMRCDAMRRSWLQKRELLALSHWVFT